MVRKTLETKIESNISVETLCAYLDEFSAPGFKIWLHDKKAYAIFKVSSLESLRKLAERIEARGSRLKFLRIVEDHYG